MANINNINQDLDNLNLENSFSCDPHECIKYINSADSSIKLLHINIRSVNKNFDSLLALLGSINIDFDLIVLTECWLSKVINLPVLNRYQSHSTKNITNQNDGVIIYTKIGLNVKVWEPNINYANSLVCQIDNKLSVVGIYRSPSNNTKDHFDSFLNSLNNIYDEISYSPSISTVGDLNIDIKLDSRNDRALEYLILNASHGLLPTHLLPTRMENCLDHVLLKTKAMATTLVLESHITDHKPIILSISNTNPTRNKSFTITRLNHEAIKTELENTDFSDIYNIKDANTAMTTLITKISTAITKHTKYINVPRKQRTLKPWITPGLLKCIKHRDKLHVKSKKSPDNLILHVTYTRYRNFCNTLLRKLKRTYEKSELEKSRNNPKALWKTIKEITNTSKICSSPVELLKICDSPASSLNYVCSFFSNVGKNMAAKIINDPNKAPPDCETIHAGNKKTLKPPVNSLAIQKVDECDIDTIILQMRHDCAVGWDGISSSLLKTCRHILVSPITYICNLCIETGVFPNSLKKAIVHPIFKGGNRDCVDNYRPISVLSSLSKILEKILNQNLRSFLDKYKLIADNQYGFRSGVSTEDAVLDLTQFIARTLDSRSKCLGIFLDLSKAFDTVSVPKLISKLESLGVRGIALEIFKDYLRNRTQLVKIGSSSSDEEVVLYGVPQGSILGPTLFQIYIDDLCRMSIPASKIYAYADDTAILVDGPSWEDVKRKAEFALSSMMNWLDLNLLTLNLKKTYYLPFAIRCNSKPTSSFTITAHSCRNQLMSCSCPSIARAVSVKYLGVHIDDGLKWDKQLDTLTTRTLRLIHIFKSLRESASVDILKMVYYTLCQSIIGYCITVWGGAAKTYLLRAERSQRAVLKVMLRKPYRYPTSQLYADCKVLTVRQLFILQSVLRIHARLPPSDPMKRTYVPPGVQYKTSFARRQFYVLSHQVFKKIQKELDIIDLNKFNVKSKTSNWLLKQDYIKSESLLSYIA